MDIHVKDFFSQFHDESQTGHFHKVIQLHDSPHISWETISSEVPSLCKGWYELAQLSSKDRIEFKRDFWLARLPYHPNICEFLINFFDSLDDIGIFITQKHFDDPYEPQIVYSVRENCGFFRGGAGASEKELNDLQKLFPNDLLPEDYKAFLRIHNGFCKTTDCTGMIKTTSMKHSYDIFQELLNEENVVMNSHNKPVNPQKLIPFYESFGMPFYQCFWAEWYPEQEMGNVYYSNLTKKISDTDPNNLGPESMSFPTFVDWLMFYMELIK